MAIEDIECVAEEDGPSVHGTALGIGHGLELMPCPGREKARVKGDILIPMNHHHDGDRGAVMPCGPSPTSQDPTSVMRSQDFKMETSIIPSAPSDEGSTPRDWTKGHHSLWPLSRECGEE